MFRSSFAVFLLISGKLVGWGLVVVAECVPPGHADICCALWSAGQMGSNGLQWAPMSSNGGKWEK